MANSAEALRKRFEEELVKFKQLEKDKEKSIANRQQLEGQLTENNMVKEEFDFLDEESVVYKLIGPVMVKQDLNEAKQNVAKRVEYISNEIKRLEETMKDTASKQEAQKEALMKM
uniref:Probable prefoldin subunit 6 n=1 Tax=Plectus sambesii TaxID=2011161 RepID=A0A914UXG2_9BILA